MSAFLVDKEHIDYLITAALEFPQYGCKARWGETLEITEDTADEVGRGLMIENARSFSYRYPDEPVPMPSYHYTRPKGRIDPVQVFKAIHCLDYQSCEHPGWKSSKAFAFLQDLTTFTIYQLPGYDAAAWHIVGGEV